MKKLIVLVGLVCHLAYADFKPGFVSQADPYFGHHVIVAEKATHTLYLYKQNDQSLKLVKKYPMATGLIPGDKKVQGDRKTPEGIYITNEFLSSDTLMKKYGSYGKMYGIGAFTLSYPNPYDRLVGKTGGGIWLHSTDDESRISKQRDSKGCVVINDKNLIDISKKIDLKNTIFIITNEISYLAENNWNNKKTNFLGLIENWKQAWNKSDFKNYIKHYSNNFYDHNRGNFKEFSAYKKNIFRADLQQSVNFDHISVFSHGNYALVVMRQDYKSRTINDMGKKILHLIRDDKYQWKILREGWSRLENKGPLKIAQEQKHFNISQAQ